MIDFMRAGNQDAMGLIHPEKMSMLNGDRPGSKKSPLVPLSPVPFLEESFLKQSVEELMKDER